MMKKYLLFISLFIFSVFLFFACKDQSENPNATPQGTYSIEPSYGVAGDKVIISGDFSNVNPNKLIVLIGGKTAAINVDKTSITCFIPSELPLGLHKVVILHNGYTYIDQLEYTVIMPEVTGMQGQFGEEAFVGDEITIKGTNFPYPPTLTAWLNGKEINIFRAGPSSVSVVANAAGTIELKVDGVSLKGPTLKVIDPSEIFTQHTWAISSADRLLGEVYNYKGLIGDFTFNTDSTYTRSENGVISKGKWKIWRNNNITGNPFVLKFDDITYNDLIKISRDTLIFKYYQTAFAYKLIPASKVPIVQDIPGSNNMSILTRPKLWTYCKVSSEPGVYLGQTLTFFPDGTLESYSLSSNYIYKGKWFIGSILGKTMLKIIFDFNPDNSFDYECTEISFDKFEIKEFNGNYFKPRYW